MKLDIGCGKNKVKGAVGLDMNPTFLMVGDIQYEINGRSNSDGKRLYLPFRNSIFDKVYMYDIIEHVKDTPWLLSEVHRIAKPNVLVTVRYPHYSFRDTYSDITHVHNFGYALHTLDHFDPSTYLGKHFQYYTQFGRKFPFKIVSKKLDFPPISVVNQFSRLFYKLFREDFFEIYLSKLFPVGAITLEMKVLK